MKLNWCRTLMPAAALLAALLPRGRSNSRAPAAAPAPAVQQNPVCARLETQLQTFDRTNNDAGRAEQLGKFEAAAASQQTEIDRQEATSRRMGCAQNRFFQMLGNQPQQCTPLNNKIQQMRDNLEKIQADAERLRGEPPPEREGQRRTILAALAQSNCGAQYQQQVAAPPPKRAGLFESLFGPRSTPAEPGAPGPGGDVPGMSTPAGSYRTVCVRTCDGFYYPISYATSPARFAEDEKACRASCPAAEVQLYSSPTGGSINDAVSGDDAAALHGDAQCVPLPHLARPELQLPQARRKLVAGVEKHRRPHGRAGRHRRERPEGAAVVGAAGRCPGPADPAAAAAGASRSQDGADHGATCRASRSARPRAEGCADDTPSKPDPNRKVRDVGPTFLPGR